MSGNSKGYHCSVSQVHRVWGLPLLNRNEDSCEPQEVFWFTFWLPLFFPLLTRSTALSFIMGLLVWISVRQLEKPCPRLALGRLRSKVLLLSAFTELGRCCLLLSNERGGLRSHLWNVSGEGRLGESRWPAQHSTSLDFARPLGR